VGVGTHANNFIAAIMITKKIILASISPRRKELLLKTGLTFDVVPTSYEEDMSLSLKPEDLVKYLSKGKTFSLADSYKDALIIGADTIVVYDGKILGKPHTPEGSVQMLNLLKGKEHSVFTGFTVLDTKDKKYISKVVETKIFFNDLSCKEIEDYVKTGEPLDKAGGYHIQGMGRKFINKFEGSEDSVAGLPVKELMEVLKEFRVKPKHYIDI
jgi:septum formation protein